MKLTSITITGLRRRGSCTVPLAPLTLLYGPNGSGKSTVIGAIVYALTGRYPGLVGDNADDLLTLAPDPSVGFEVILRAEGPQGPVTIRRGVTKDKLFVEAESGTDHTKSARGAAEMIRRLFGDVSMAVSAFDPEKSIWRLSPEKRTKWAFSLCAGGAGWTKARLLKLLGPKSDDWNPDAGDDAADCLDRNIADLTDRVRAAQKVAREARVVADGIATPPEPPSKEEIDAAEAARDAARDAVAELRRLAASINGAQAEREAVRRDRARLTANLEHTKAEFGKLLPPEQPPSEDDSALQEMEGALVAAEMDADVCSACGAVRPTQATQAIQAQLVVLRRAKVERDARIARLRREAERFQEAWQTLLSNQQVLERSLAALPPEPQVADEGEGLSGKIGAALQREAERRNIAADLRHREGLAHERAGQLQAADRAAARVEEMKKLGQKMRAARNQMLADALGPMQQAVARLQCLAPPDGTWNFVERPGLGVVLGYANETRGFVGPMAMSTGERFRATLTLLLAVAAVRREPWVGLFLDNFEQVSDDAVFGAFQGLIVALRAGVVDNVLVADLRERAQTVLMGETVEQDPEWWNKMAAVHACPMGGAR